jgi:uncharacterized membrane protein YkvI
VTQSPGQDRFSISKAKVIPGIAATFIGTVIGAGFASGREIDQFFSIHGLYGWLGLALAVLLLGIAGVKVFQTGAALKPKSYQDFLVYLWGIRLAPVMDYLLLTFLIILIGVMFAGCGAIFETINSNYWVGSLVTGFCLILILVQEFAGVIWINLVIVPLMLLGSIVISISAIQTGSSAGSPMGLPLEVDFSWMLASLQFSAYNIVLAIPVLLSLGKNYPGHWQLKMGGWLGSIGLGIMAGLIHWSILVHFLAVHQYPLPMAILAKSAGEWIYRGYMVVLWGEMFTTLIANTYGVAQRFAAITGWSFRIWVFILTCAGIAIGKMGFINLIAGFYPVFGYLCLVTLFLIILKPLPSLLFSAKKRHKE